MPTSCGKCLEHKTNIIQTQCHMDRPSNTDITAARFDKHKIDITVAQCQMESAWNRKQVSHQPNVKWTGP